MITGLLEKGAYKRSYNNKASKDLNLCIDIVEDIIQAFSNKDITCDACRNQVSNIISNHLGGGHELETREKRSFNSYAKKRPHYN